MTGPVLFKSLRSLVQRRTPAPQEACDLCATALDKSHEHLVAPSTGMLLCACPACGLLFPARKGARFKKVPRRVLALGAGSASVWASLAMPVGLGFFFRRSALDRVTGVYPSPAGPTPAAIDQAAWERLLEGWPALATLEADVEALLLHSLDGRRDAFLVPIDLCYDLVGRLRQQWRGLSGGDAVRTLIPAFFQDLKVRAETGREGVSHV